MRFNACEISNLELLEFKARVMLSKDSEFTEEVDKSEKKISIDRWSLKLLFFSDVGKVHAPALMF